MMVALIEAWLKVSTSEPRVTPISAISSSASSCEIFNAVGPTAALLYDLRRFIMEFMDPIVASTLHIYTSALSLVPSRAELSRYYGHLTEGGVRVVRGRPEQWSQTLWIASKHSQRVTCTAVSPDGATIVSGSDDGTLCLWDAKTGAAIGEPMMGHTHWVSCVAVSPDSTTIISGSYDETLCLWDAKTGAAIGESMMGHTSWVSCVAVSPDSTTIVSGSNDGTLCLWDAKTGAAIEEPMIGHTGGVSCVAVSPDSTTIISGSYDETLHLWDAKTGAAIGEPMMGHTGGVSCVAVSPDSTTIVSGSYDETLHLWDAKTGAAIEEPIIHPPLLIDPTPITIDHKCAIPVIENTKLLPNIQTPQAIHSINIPSFQLNLTQDGWLLHFGHKRMFWLPVDLRGTPVLQGHFIVIQNPKVPIFNVSAWIH
ncbi:hypothetical protein FRB95_005136 [Tulasnella sp. JGI-2019a]|nr:hypothetical protein FRB95_005136 [Tulasnella sp. JGI-2019a]